MDFLTFLRNYFVVGTIARLIERRNTTESVVTKKIFANRVNWPLATISMEDIEGKIGNKAVVARGAHSLPVGKDAMTITMIEPMPVSLSSTLTAAKLNDLKTIFGQGTEVQQANAQAYLDRIILNMMASADKTRDALCAQALTGKIDYMMKSDSGYERYKVQYGDGNALTFTPSKCWQEATIAEILADCNAMQQELAKKGVTGSVEFLAGYQAFGALANKICSLPNDQRMGASVSKNEINLCGYVFTLANSTYADKAADGSDVVKYEVDAAKVVAFVPGYAELDYCALDDLDCNLQAVPFFSKYVKQDDPSGYKVMGESKPMPLISPKSVCWAEVYDADYVPTDNSVNVEVNNGVDDTKYTQAQLNAHTKEWILDLADARGYEMTKTSSDTKADIITEFLAKQNA